MITSGRNRSSALSFDIQSLESVPYFLFTNSFGGGGILPYFPIHESQSIQGKEEERTSEQYRAFVYKEQSI